VDVVEFGRYRLIEVIGEGGMGKMYKAHATTIGRDVAIKVLPTELGAEPGYRERFRREAHTAARLTEPHIVPIYDTGEIEGHLYLVMPVLDGIDVHGLLKRDGPMTPQRAVRVIEQLAAALNAAHEHGLVHRDVKPSNALLTGDDFVYLIDFGIAHDAAAIRLTSTGMIVGTLAYMAPERFLAGTADARADVYSLACVLYECQPAPTSGQTAQPAPTSPDPAALAPFVGHWGAHEQGIEIDSTGTGNLRYPDFRLCPNCSQANAPRGTVDFTLTSVSNGVASGSVTASSDAQNYGVGDPVTAQIVPGLQGKGVVLQMTIGGTQQLPFCNSTSSGQCGA
jgi:serine/threonine protein kinase